MDANTKSVLEKLRRDFEDGEDLKFLQQVSRISVYFKTDPGWTDFVPCMLIITNFQLTFSFADESINTINVPITSIDSCSRKSKSRKLNLYCKDFRSLILQFQSNPELDMVYKHIGKYIKFKDPSVLAFAFWYTPIAADPGWTMFSPLKEYERMGLTAPNSLWRISDCNTSYTVCDSYPELLCVPKDFTDQNIRAVAKFRSRNRMPVLTWLDNRNTTDYTSPDRDTRRYSSITRCSMPLVGVSGSRNYQDESLVTMFLMSNPRQQSVSIVDCRPRAVGVGSLANGGGYEFGSGYENCKVSFMSVENIHVMRESFAQLFALLQDSKKGTSSWYSKLESASWFRHLRLIMQASMRVVEIIEREHGSALVHCTDGWDRTSQITSLAQLCLDPHYRSIEGFLLLIEKDWLWFGHKFQERTFGSERSPVFLQFLDCVHQIMHQYPCSFEFNQQLLVFLVDSLYSCRFGTFLHDTPKERVENKTMQKTLSAWSYILNNKRQFLNPFYTHRNETLYPAYSEKKIVFWTEYYMRWTSNPFETVEDIAMKQLERAEAKLLQLQATLSSSQAELLKQVIDEFPYLCDSKLRQPSLNASGEGFKRPAKPFGTLGKSTGKNTLGKSNGLNADVFLSSHRDSDAQERSDLFTSGDIPEELPEMDPAVEFQVMDRRERQRNRLESTEFCEWEQNRKLNVNATILQISSKNKAAMQMFKDIDETLDDSEDTEQNFMYDDDTTNDDDEPTQASPDTPTPLHQRVLMRENKKAAARRSGLLLANSAMYFQPTPGESNDVEHDLAPSAVKQISVAAPPKVMPKVPVPPPKKQHTAVKSFTPPKVAPPKAPGSHKSLQPNTALIIPAQNQAQSPQAHSPPQQNGALSPRGGKSPPPPPRDTKPTLSPRPGLKTSPSLPHLPSVNGVTKSTEPTSPRGAGDGSTTVKLPVKK